MDLSSFVSPVESPIIAAMTKINANSKGIVFITDAYGVVVAALTDGDIRRYIISGKPLNAPAIDAANRHFHYVSTDEEYRDAHKVCAEKSLTAVPKLDSAKRLVAIYFQNDEAVRTGAKLSAPVVIMAGGKGTRLYPYTKILPKPLVPIGGATITEHIMDKFAEYGINDFIMVVNHKKNMIKAYFADEGQERHVKFVDEEAPLGTGGGLKLLEDIISETFFMTNCDILISADYSKILSAHKESRNIVTMVCAAKTFSIPYGTVNLDSKGKISSLSERPSFPLLVNTGLYVIEPNFMKYIKPGAFTHITETIQTCVDSGEIVGIFPVGENDWSDMGQFDEMEKMKRMLGIHEE